jgi:hypothetical protein
LGFCGGGFFLLISRKPNQTLIAANALILKAERKLPSRRKHPGRCFCSFGCGRLCTTSFFAPNTETNLPTTCHGETGMRFPNSSSIPQSALPRCVRVWRRRRLRPGQGEHPRRPSLCSPPCKYPPPSSLFTTTRVGPLKELPSTTTDH